MPNILAIETTLPSASIALKQGDRATITEGFESHRKQNQLLFNPLKKLLNTLPNGEKLDLIIIGTGPGSYSGSRISIAAAQGIAVAHACPVVGQSSFLATEIGLQRTPALAVGDARRGAYFISKLPGKGLPTVPELMERSNFDELLEHSTSNIFTLEPNFHFANGSEIPLQKATAENHIQAWLQLSREDQDKLLSIPPAPAYLRAPFITKAKAGHPLLRGKVKE